MSQKRKAKGSPGVYVPPKVFVGELLIWKGYRWKLQAFSPNGGQVTLEDETNKSQTGQFRDAVLVLECAGKSAGHEKREKAAAKRPMTIKRDGFRPQPLTLEPKKIIEVKPNILTPAEVPLVIPAQ